MSSSSGFAWNAAAALSFDWMTKMSNRLNRLMRRVAPLLGAGMLLQAGGCTVNFNELFAGLANSVVNELITGIIFGVFNIANF